MDQPVGVEAVAEAHAKAAKVVDHNARHYRDDCLICVEVQDDWTRLEALLGQANRLSAQMANVEVQMRSLQEEFRGVRYDVTMAARSLKHHVGMHQRCPLCRGLVGKAHAHGELVKEPFGPDRCCEGCSRNLVRWNSTVALELVSDRRKVAARATPHGVPE